MRGADWKWRHGPFSVGDPGSHYNGASWDERLATTPIQRAAKMDGRLTRPQVCGITGEPASSAGGYVFTHCEDYSRPLWTHAVGRWTHHKLHQRFTDPLPWNRIVRANYEHGAWFTFLTMEPTDMQRTFREVYPRGLPSDSELWPAVADELGVSPAAFSTTKAEVACNGLQTGNLFRATCGFRTPD